MPFDLAAAETPAVSAPAPPAVINCAIGYPRLVEIIATQKGGAKQALGLPYATWVNGRLGVVFVIAPRGDPAYPAIIRRQIIHNEDSAGAGGVPFATSACGFGDKAAFGAWTATVKASEGKLDAALGSPGMK